MDSMKYIKRVEAAKKTSVLRAQAEKDAKRVQAIQAMINEVLKG